MIKKNDEDIHFWSIFNFSFKMVHFYKIFSKSRYFHLYISKEKYIDFFFSKTLLMLRVFFKYCPIDFYSNFF